MLNKAQVIGHLGQEPKIATSQNGKAIATFSVATTDKAYTAPNGVTVPERTEWHNIICFGRMADVAQKYLHKGSRVYVEGKMRTRSYDGKDGVKRYVMEINTESLVMLDNKPQANNGGGYQPQQGYSQNNDGGGCYADSFPF